MVLIPFGGAYLALELEDFQAAIMRGREFLPCESPSDTCGTEKNGHVVDAKGAAALTGVPATWFLEQARQGEIPHHKFGKYIRFDMDDLRKHVAIRAKHHITR